jgi:hypothetical protein
MDKVITVSQNGVAAYSDKYAELAKINASIATLMRKQAELELQSALSKVSKEVQSASSDFITFGDSLVSSLNGYASVKLFDGYLSTLNITTNNFSDALKQAAASGQTGQTAMNSMIATVGALSVNSISVISRHTSSQSSYQTSARIHQMKTKLINQNITGVW